MGEGEVWCRVTVTCDDGRLVTGLVLEGPSHPDIVMVDAFARLALLAGRAGCSLVLCEVSPAARELLELAGLGERFAGLGVEVEGQAEGRE